MVKYVGVTQKQGLCFRCQKEKEVILFSQSSGGIVQDGKKVELASTDVWCCQECFSDAVAEQSHVHYI